MTPLQEIFILLEDEKKVPLWRLARWGKKMRGVLAKLKNYGWVEKKALDGETYYIITKKGEREIDRILRNLRETGKWDGRWRLVIFNLPEKQRDLRDRIRRALNRLGMGILQPSVWISPKDIKNEVEEIRQRLHLENSLKFFEVGRNRSLDKTIIEKSWNLPDLDDDYKKFIFDSSRVLKAIDKDPNAKYTAKKMIFIFSLILQKDPILPWEFRENEPLRKKAHELYLKLRTYVV